MGYTGADWANFALAVTAAAATLAGLLFVAMSINLQRILSFPNLPARAAQTLILFATPLFTGVFVVVPGQPRTVLGSELLATGIAIGTALVVIDARAPLRPGRAVSRASAPTSRAGRCAPAVSAHHG